MLLLNSVNNCEDNNFINIQLFDIFQNMNKNILGLISNASQC